MDMENLVLKFVDGLDIVHHLPYEVRGIVIDAQVGRGQPFEYLAPDCRGGHQVLTAGPLVRTKEHGAVFNGYAHAQFLGQLEDGRPDLAHEIEVLLHGLGLVAADEGGHQVHAQPVAGTDDLLEVLHGGGALFQVAVQGVGVVCQGGDFHPALLEIAVDVVHLLVVQRVHVNVADARVAAFRLPGGPAGYFDTLVTHLRSCVHHAFKCPSIQNCTYKTQFHNYKSLPFSRYSGSCLYGIAEHKLRFQQKMARLVRGGVHDALG